MNILHTILDLIFPSACLSCGADGAEICLSCLAASPYAERECEKWIFPMYDYRHPPVKAAVHLLKYRGKRRVAATFAQALHSPILEEVADLAMMENFTEPMLVPIPLAPRRKRERGFNQSELIARELLLLDTQEKAFTFHTDVLLKPRDTVHQARVESRSDRLKNIIGSFSVKNSEKIKNKNIILIDDVTTTGATLSEARKVLLKAGARHIIAFTIAH